MYRLKQFALITPIILVLVFSSCATGPKYSAIKGSLPQLAPKEGRIYFYRTGNPFGSAIQPDVNLNGEKIGRSTPGGFFFVDRSPGNYEVVLSTEVEKKLTFTLDRGQIRYVRMSVGLGAIVYRVFPTLVEETKGISEMKGLSYTGTEVNKK